MSERTRSSVQNLSYLRSQSCCDNRDNVTRTATALHRETVDRAQRRFEQQLTKSEHELRWAVKQRHNQSSSPAEKRQATQHLANLRKTLNNDYARLIQVYVHEHKDQVNEIETYMNRCRNEDRQLVKIVDQRKLQEAQLPCEKIRLQSINQIIRERDAICEEKLAAQKNLYDRLLDEQARRLRAEKVIHGNISSLPVEHFDMAQLKGRLARVEYEHRELKQLVFDLRTDLSALMIRKPIYRSIINIPNFVKP